MSVLTRKKRRVEQQKLLNSLPKWAVEEHCGCCNQVMSFETEERLKAALATCWAGESDSVTDDAGVIHRGDFVDSYVRTA